MGAAVSGRYGEPGSAGQDAGPQGAVIKDRPISRKFLLFCSFVFVLIFRRQTTLCQLTY